MKKPLKNASHERFAQLVISGKSKSEAYREVFPRSRGWKAKDVHTEASRLYPKVSPRVEAIQEEITKLICIEKAEAVSILADALRKADPSKISATAAFAELAKTLGWYEPVKVDQGHHFAVDEAVAAKIGAELARVRAAKQP